MSSSAGTATHDLLSFVVEHSIFGPLDGIDTDDYDIREIREDNRLGASWDYIPNENDDDDEAANLRKNHQEKSFICDPNKDTPEDELIPRWEEVEAQQQVPPPSPTPIPSISLHSTDGEFSFEKMMEMDWGHVQMDDVEANACHEEPFIASLPHNTRNMGDAIAFGRPYLPDQVKRDAVERFWAKGGRKKKYLSHLCGNKIIHNFVNSKVDSTACVGMLRSMATEWGCRPVLHLAQMAEDTVYREGKYGEGSTNSFCVNREKLLASMRLEDSGNPLLGQPSLIKRPESLHPDAEGNSKILKKMLSATTKCVTLDWSDASRHVDFMSSHNSFPYILIYMLLPKPCVPHYHLSLLTQPKVAPRHSHFYQALHGFQSHPQLAHHPLSHSNHLKLPHLHSL